MDLIALRAAWISTWAELPEVVHAAFSNNRVPLKAVMTGMFPTAFADLDPALRTYRSYLKNPSLSAEDAATVRDAVRDRQTGLVAAARNYLLLEQARDGDDFGLSNPRESLSGFAWSLVEREGEIAPEDAAARLEEKYPPAATLRNLQRALGDPVLVAELEAALERAAPFGYDGLPDVSANVGDLVGLLMASTRLAALESSTEVPDDLADEQAMWGAIQADPSLSSIHRAAPGLGLAHRVPVPNPGLFQPAPRPLEPAVPGRRDLMMSPRQLEVSLVERLRRALDTDRSRLEGLTPRRVLHDEVGRAVSPVGLAATGAHAVFALLREVSMEIGSAQALRAKPGEELSSTATIPGTVLGQSFARVFARFKAAKAGTGRYARVGESVLATLDDPTQAYASEVWGRVHGHEVRDTVDFADLVVVYTKILLGVRESLLRRLDSVHDDAVLLRDPENFGLDADGPDTNMGNPGDVDVSPEGAPDRYAALAALLALLARLAETGRVTYGEVQRFVANADAAPAYQTTWDRWRHECESPNWLTYDVVVAVIPMMRVDADNTPEDE